MKTMNDVIKKIKEYAAYSPLYHFRLIQYEDIDGNKLIKDIAELGCSAHLFRADGNFTVWFREMLYDADISNLEIELVKRHEYGSNS